MSLYKIILVMMEICHIQIISVWVSQKFESVEKVLWFTFADGRIS